MNKIFLSTKMDENKKVKKKKWIKNYEKSISVNNRRDNQNFNRSGQKHFQSILKKKYTKIKK